MHIPVLHKVLTRRQLEISKLVSFGFNNDAIGRMLGITTRTVERQLTMIYRTIGLERSGKETKRVKLTLLYIESPAVLGSPTQSPADVDWLKRATRGVS